MFNNPRTFIRKSPKGVYNNERFLFWSRHHNKSLSRHRPVINAFCSVGTLSWVEAQCRDHMLSARHSTNHLGEGLRQEPIAALAGRHLIRVSERTESGPAWAVLAGEARWSSFSFTGGCETHRLGITRGWQMSAMFEVEHGSRTQFRLLSTHF